MKGRIIKGIAGVYYVNTEDAGVFKCKAKGIFRYRKIKPLPGDDVEIEIIDSTAMTGNITDIFSRRTELVRPAVANADQAVIIFAAAKPEPNLNLLDRFLVLMREQGMETAICFNKKDQVTKAGQEGLAAVYANSGCQFLMVSAKEGDGIGQLRNLVSGKTTVLAGPSGVGKSTIMNLLCPQAGMQTGSISEKIQRGRHTTRHSELFYAGDGTYLFDTPGFSSLYLDGMEKEELKEYYPEFRRFAGQCRFLGCLHDKEPGCAVKESVNLGQTSQERYANYLILLEELKNRRKY